MYIFKYMSRNMQYILLLLLSCFSHVQLCATPWTTAYQAPPSMGFSRQEYWSGVPLPSPMLYIYLPIYISVDIAYICIQIFTQIYIYMSYISRQISIYRCRYILGIRRSKIVKCLGSFGLEVKFWLGLHSPHLSLIPVLIKFKDRNISSLCEHQQYTLPQVQTVSRPTTGISVPISSLQ